MHKKATKCNKTQSKWCINKHGESKIIDTFETYQASRVEKEKAEEMEMAVPRSNAYGRQHGCSRHADHDVLGVHGWVAAMSSGRHHRGSLHGSLDACLHGHGLMAALAILPSIQFL
jgi:hypothetical protein